MIIIFFLCFLNLFSFVDKDSLLCNHSINNDEYSDVIKFYKIKLKLDDEKILFFFNNLKHYGISEEDIFLIDLNDFIIFLLEYSLLYANIYLYINIIDFCKLNLNEKNKNNVDEVLIKFNNKMDNFFEDIYLRKIKLYLDYKKNNKDYNAIIKSSYAFICAGMDTMT